ncbi:MAG: hypothetical protein ACE5Z5_04505 [Candidatus Bathyarchaeia archaeon]
MFQRKGEEEELFYPLNKSIEDRVSEALQTFIATVYECEHIKELLAEKRRDKRAVRELRQVVTKDLEALKELQKLVKRMKLKAREEK